MGKKPLPDKYKDIYKKDSWHCLPTILTKAFKVQYPSIPPEDSSALWFQSSKASKYLIYTGGISSTETLYSSPLRWPCSMNTSPMPDFLDLETAMCFPFVPFLGCIGLKTAFCLQCSKRSWRNALDWKFVLGYRPSCLRCPSWRATESVCFEALPALLLYTLCSQGGLELP